MQRSLTSITLIFGVFSLLSCTAPSPERSTAGVDQGQALDAMITIDQSQSMDMEHSDLSIEMDQGQDEDMGRPVDMELTVDMMAPDMDPVDMMIADMDPVDMIVADMDPDMEPIDMMVADMEHIDMMVADMNPVDMMDPDMDPVDMMDPDMDPVDMMIADMDPVDMDPPEPEEPTAVQLRGLVTDPSGEPVEGAQVWSSFDPEQVVITDSLGAYQLSVASSERHVLNILAEGMTPRHLILTTWSSDLIKNVTLASIAPPISLNAEEGGAVERWGASVTITAGSLVDETGQLVSGEVSVELTPFDITQDGLEYMPGDFSAIDAQDEEVFIESFGFVKLRVSQGGQELQLAEGSTATLEVPIASPIALLAPEVIPLWNFDEETGAWVERGVATKVQRATGEWVYQGALSSFGSYWNCDEVMEVVNLNLVLGDLSTWMALGDIATWLLPGAGYVKVAWLVASKAYTLYGLLKTISEIDPNQGATIGQLATIAQSIFALSGAGNPLDNAALLLTAQQLNQLSTDWAQVRPAVAQRPETWLHAHQVDRALRQLELTQQYASGDESVAPPPSFTATFEVLTQSVTSEVSAHTSAQQAGAIELLQSRADTLGVSIDQPAQITAELSAVTLEDGASAQGITRSVRLLDALYVSIGTLAQDLNLDLTTTERSELPVEQQLIDLYALALSLDDSLLELDTLWAPETSEGTELEVRGVDYLGVTRSSTNPLGFATIPARYGSEVELVIRRGESVSEPISINTADTPLVAQDLGVIFPTVSAELTSFTLAMVYESGEPVEGAVIKLSDQSKAKTYGPFVSDVAGHTHLTLARSEEPGQDHNGNGVTGEEHRYVVTVFHEGVSYSFGPHTSPTSPASWTQDPEPRYTYTLTQSCLAGTVTGPDGQPLTSGTVRVGEPYYGFGDPVPLQADGHFEVITQRSEVNADLDQDGILGEAIPLSVVVDDGENEFVFSELTAPLSSIPAGCVSLDPLVTEDRRLEDRGTVTGAFELPNQRFTYTVEVPGERVLELQLTNAPATTSPIGYNISLYAPNGERLKQHLSLPSTSRGTDVVKRWLAPTRGLYTVRVTSYLGEVDPSLFSLSLHMRPLLDALLEPNNSRASATELASGVPLEGAIAYDDDRDDYVIEASGEQLLEVELLAPEVSYGGSIRVFDELERSVCSTLFDQSPPLNLSGVCYLPEAGRYFIQVESHLGRSDYEASYTLTATLRPVPDEAQEPDNTKDTANVLDSGVPFESYLSYLYDEDHYRIEASGEQLIEVSLEAPDASYGGTLSITDDLGTSLCTTLLDTVAPINMRGVCYVPEAGSYFIKVKAHLGLPDYEEAYTLTATLLPAPDEAQEPDNTLDSAQALNSGAPITSYLSYKNDADYYSIDASGEQLLEVDVTGAEVSYGGYLQVYDELGASIHYTLTDISPPFGLSAVYYLPNEGRYFIKVSGYLGGYDYESPYTLSATLHTAPDQDQEPNNTQEDATPLSSGASLETYVSYTGDVDYYSIEATGAQQLQVAVTSDELSFGGYLYFYNALGVSICSTVADIFAPLSIDASCDLPEAGTYFVKFASYLSRSSVLEAYTITATLQSP